MAAPEAIGPYRVVRLLGKGGMGQVYEARQPGTDRTLAVKLLPSLFADDESRTRFEREGELLARIRHRNVVPVLDAGFAQAGPWLAMELIEGEELRASADGRALGPRQAAALVADLAEGVAALHAAGIVHRDLKPGNVIVRPEGTPVIIDFGLARAADVQRLTRTGDMLGTPAYMAPEQASGEHGPAADVYALGAILYHLLTGRPPFVGKSAVEVFKGILHQDPPDPAGLGVELDRGLWEILRRTLAKDPAKRPPSAAALREQLRAWVASTGTRRHGTQKRLVPLPLLLLGVVSVAGFAGLSHWLAPVPPPPPVVRTYEEPGLTGPGDLPETTLANVLSLTVVPRGSGTLRLSAGAYVASNVAPGVPHRFTVELEKGDNRITIRLEDEREGKAEQVVSIRSEGFPLWFAALPEAQRPPRPLPEGLTCGKEGLYLNAADGSELVWIPPGQVHTLAGSEDLKGFYLGRTEVTVGQFKRFYATGPANYPTPGGKLRDELLAQVNDLEPAATVNWDEARRYCEWAGLRLPRAVEWERAARGDDDRPYPWGHAGPFEPEARANLPGPADGHERLARVGTFLLGASQHGCLDLAGSVCEWAADLHPNDALRAGGREDHRTICGGHACGWEDMKESNLPPEQMCAVDRHRSVNKVVQLPALGFRVARNDR